MRITLQNIFILLIFLSGCTKSINTVWIETESFQNKGGWVIDQQSMDVMGSPYLMAHGLGNPVADASTTVTFPKKGEYRMFVRTRNWTAPWSNYPAGLFQIKLDGEELRQEFGKSTREWSWIDAGTIDVQSKEKEIILHDLTGFNGRCDAIFFTDDLNAEPPNTVEEMEIMRRDLYGENLDAEVEEFDFIVVGGGMAGTCAAISASRLGLKVALIQNRPVLGGNNSSEVRVHLGGRINLEPYPELGNLVNEIGPSRFGNAQPKDYYEDDRKMQAVMAESNITLFLNYHANDLIMNGERIESIIAQNIETGMNKLFSATIFADCTGDGTIGYLAGAEYMLGRESRATFNEATAPEKADSLTMGISVQWFSEGQEEAVSFPDISWGLEMDDDKSFSITKGDWDWETGMGKDMIKETEFIRDYGLYVVYSNWSYLKNHHSLKDSFSNEHLKWLAYIGGKRESRRLIGDYILTENDLTQRNVLPDGTAPTSWTIDLHYPDMENQEKFDGEAFRSIAKHIPIYPYPIPFRCLYSKNIENLMMAGRNISVSHVALGTVRLMRTGGMMGEVLGMAASICKKEQVMPRGVYQSHLTELIELMNKGVGDSDIPFRQDYNQGRTLLKMKN